MKKYLFILSAGFIYLLTSCSDKKEGGMSDTAKKNAEASQTVAKAFETGDTSKINDVVAADFIDHTERGDMGRDSLKAGIIMMHTQMPDMKFTTVKELADDEYVSTWYEFTGTSDGSMGMPKGPFKMNSIEVVKFKDGKGIEHWSFMESREMMKMMGAPQNAMPMSDSTKKMDNK